MEINHIFFPLLIFSSLVCLMHILKCCGNSISVILPLQQGQSITSFTSSKRLPNKGFAKKNYLKVMRKRLRDAIKKKYATFKIFHHFVFFFSTLKEILLCLSVTVAVKMTRLRSLFTHLELILSLVLFKTLSASLVYWSTFIYILSSSCCKSKLQNSLIGQDFFPHTAKRKPILLSAHLLHPFISISSHGDLPAAD